MKRLFIGGPWDMQFQAINRDQTFIKVPIKMPMYGSALEPGLIGEYQLNGRRIDGRDVVFYLYEGSSMEWAMSRIKSVMSRSDYRDAFGE